MPYDYQLSWHLKATRVPFSGKSARKGAPVSDAGEADTAVLPAQDVLLPDVYSRAQWLRLAAGTMMRSARLM